MNRKVGTVLNFSQFLDCKPCTILQIFKQIKNLTLLQVFEQKCVLKTKLLKVF